jgi:single-strand DNA-binding protein
MNYNHVVLGGRLTRDPELKTVGTKNTALTKFGMAVNEAYKGSDGSKKERAVFVDVAAWGRTGEVIHEYLKKGDPIFIAGRLEFSQWDDKATGQKRSKLSVVAESFQFVGGKKDSAPPSDEPDPEIPF